MSSSCRLNLFLPLVLCLVVAWPVSRAAAAEGWKFELPIYAWLPDINTELPSGQKTEITLDDILSNLDMTFMAQPRLHNDKWSVTADLIYFDLSNKDRESVDALLDLRQLELQSSVITPSIGYRVYRSGGNWAELYAGARYVWLKTTLKLQQQAPLPPGSFHVSESDSRWDGVVGVRGGAALGPRWFVPYAADVGTGESDLVYNLLLGIGYRFKSLDAVAAWRYLDYDFGDNWVLKTMNVNGPLLGVVFRF